jgi:hypothetical protein
LLSPPPRPLLTRPLLPRRARRPWPTGRVCLSTPPPISHPHPQPPNPPQALYLSGNEVKGTLPAAYSAAESLSELYLNDNMLTGTLPIAWAAAPLGANLQEL